MNNGIVGAIIALLLGAQQKDWKSGTPGGWMQPVTPASATPTGNTLPPTKHAHTTELVDSFSINNQRPTGAVLVDIPAPTPAPTPAAPRRDASTGWRWFTPGGVVKSRPPTEDEKALGCPEIPGIWDMSRNALTGWRYCANPDCPSNNQQIELDGTVLSPTPAVLQQEVDNAGNVSYYCPVCRNRSV